MTWLRSVCLTVALVLTAGMAGAAPSLADLRAVRRQVEQGDVRDARNELRRLRDAEFPGVAFSSETCRDRPAFALMVAAERKLAAGDTGAANNYLQQLQCLAVAGDTDVEPKARWRRMRGLLGAKPARVDACPGRLGEVALQRGEQALQAGKSSVAWNALLRAACTLGLDEEDVSRLRGELEPPLATASGAEPEAVPPPPPPAPIVVPAPAPAAPAPPRPAPVVDPSPSDDPQAPISTPVKRPEPAGAEPQESTAGSEPGDALRERIARQTKPGEMAFNPPESMQVNRGERIEVRIQPVRVDTRGMAGGGVIRIEPIGVTPSMSVKLCCGPPAEDHPFDIVAQSSERQLVTSDGFTQWVFDVTPRRFGTQTLTLSVAAQYQLPNGEIVAKDYPVTTREIRVAVSEAGTLPAWLIALGAGLAAFVAIALVWTRRHRANRGARIFISYRRADAGGWVQTLNDRLAERFGDANVFMDVQDIAPGSDFVSALHGSLKETRVVLIVIGPQWLDIRNAAGERRLDDAQDWVRLEVKAALDSGKRVIPLLVGGAEMPAASALPDDLKGLARRQAVRLYADQYSASIDLLIKAIESGG